MPPREPFLLRQRSQFAAVSYNVSLVRPCVQPSELRHGGVTRLRDSFTPYYLPDGLSQNGKVQPETPMVDVPNVESESLIPVQQVPAIDLSPSSDSGSYSMTAHLLGGITFEILR